MVGEASEPMIDTRDKILNRIEAATAPHADNRAEAYRRIARRYKEGGERDPTARLDLFVQRLCDYDATVYRCGEDEISKTVALALQSREKPGLVIPSDIPSAWLPERFEFPSDQGMTYQ